MATLSRRSLLVGLGSMVAAGPAAMVGAATSLVPDVSSHAAVLGDWFQAWEVPPAFIGGWTSPLVPGEAADLACARERLAAIRANPALLVTGDELAERLATMEDEMPACRRPLSVAEQDMIDGYMDASDRSLPEPGANRSEAYRHGFANRRDDQRNEPRSSAAALRAEADDIVRRDAELTSHYIGLDREKPNS